MADEIDPKLYYAFMNKYGKEQDALRFQLDPTQELETFQYNLRGMDFDEESGTWVNNKDKKPLINNKGANMILTFASPRLSKLSSLSNMDEEDIKKRALDFEEDMYWAMARHQHEFDIPSFQVMGLISSTMGDLNMMTSMRSIQGWEGDGIRKQQTIVESKETITDNRSKPKMPFVNPFGGNRNG